MFVVNTVGALTRAQTSVCPSVCLARAILFSERVVYGSSASRCPTFLKAVTSGVSASFQLKPDMKKWTGFHQAKVKLALTLELLFSAAAHSAQRQTPLPTRSRRPSCPYVRGCASVRRVRRPLPHQEAHTDELAARQSKERLVRGDSESTAALAEKKEAPLESTKVPQACPPLPTSPVSSSSRHVRARPPPLATIGSMTPIFRLRLSFA